VQDGGELTTISANYGDGKEGTMPPLSEPGSIDLDEGISQRAIPAEVIVLISGCQFNEVIHKYFKLAF
jgi:hypothetical protein